MLPTYQGVLRDDRIEWCGDSPGAILPGQGIAVHVTLLERTPALAKKEGSGQRMATALEKVAALAALDGIADPAAWERETRQDRPLPGRES
jgi:hypothetical protein